MLPNTFGPCAIWKPTLREQPTEVAAPAAPLQDE